MREKLTKFAATGLAIYILYSLTIGVKEILWYRAIFLGLIILLAFFQPQWSSSKHATLAAVFDWIFGIASLSSTIYILANYERIASRVTMLAPITFWDIIFGLVTILLLLEATRRAVCFSLALITALCLAYMFFGPYLPGLLYHRGFTLTDVIDGMYLTLGGVFGSLTGVASSYIVVYIMFGGFLLASKVGDFFFDLANSAVGTVRGGPGKVAIIASAFFGMITGSPTASAATTGAFTIPMMTRIGMRPVFAAAVEAVAATGGSISPPVMGSVAFIMAEYTSTPYASIALMFVVPSLLYYGALYYAVHLEALKTGLKGLTRDELVPTRKVLLERGYLIIPLFVLIFFLAWGRTAVSAALWAILVCVLMSWLKRETRMGISSILSAMQKGVINSVSVSLACAAAGIIVGTFALSGLGGKLVSIILSFSFGFPPLTLLFTAIIALIIGIPLPISASYIIVVVIGVPVLLAQGFALLPAHSFVLFFAALATITPPVAITSFTTAGIAGSDPDETGWLACRIGLSGWIIPFIFVYNPSILLLGPLWKVIPGVITAIVGVLALTTAISGWLVIDISGSGVNLSFRKRIFFFILACLMLFPFLMTNLLGIILFLLIIIVENISYRHSSNFPSAL